MSPFFYCLVGPAGSGKSTYAEKKKKVLEEHFGMKCEIVSSDAIREELWGDASIQDNPQKVFHIMHTRTKYFLEKGISVIYDACNLGEKYRRHLVKELGAIDCIKMVEIFIERPEVCIARQELRERKVPAEVIWKQIKEFQMPHSSEGWDGMNVHCRKFTTEEFADFMEPMRTFDQKSLYHAYPLYEHMQRARDYAVEHEFDATVCTAAAYHDVGKMFTQTFGDNGRAHYYGHEHVSSYFYFLLTGDLWYKGQEIAWLIDHHMDFFKHPIYIERLIKNIDDQELWERLEDLHECDVEAHRPHED